MTQCRSAPAFQEYAAAMMSRFEYRTLTLAQRGLLYSMRLECWVNQFLPDSPEIIARMLGFDRAEIAADLPFVMSFFDVQNGRIFAPDLEAYRSHLNSIRERQAQGGKAGAEKTNARKSRTGKGVRGKSGKPTANPSSEPTGSPAGNCRVLSTVQPSPAQPREGSVVGVTGDSGVLSEITLSPDWEVDHGL